MPDAQSTDFNELNPSLPLLDFEQMISTSPAVVKGGLEGHGGKVLVEPAPGEGSTFFFALPAS